MQRRSGQLLEAHQECVCRIGELHFEIINFYSHTNLCDTLLGDQPHGLCYTVRSRRNHSNHFRRQILCDHLRIGDPPWVFAHSNLTPRLSTTRQMNMTEEEDPPLLSPQASPATHEEGTIEGQLRASSCRRVHPARPRPHHSATSTI
jgi:hypothetical protein